MNRNILKGIICCGVLVFIISACATVKNFAGFFRHTDGKKNNEEKLTTFAQAMRPARGNSDAHFLLARYYQERGNHHEAIIEFEKTLAIDPGNVKALNAMGVSCDFLKQFERALDCYQAALRLDADSANIYYNNIGQSLYLQGKYGQAIEAFKKAAAYDEDFPNARVHDNLGKAYAMSGQYDLAVAEFEKGSGSASVKSFMDRVLLAEKQQAAGAIEAVTAGAETKAFASRVSKFLEEKRASINMPQKQQASGDATNIYVEVSNGNGKDFMARDMRDSLIREGFRVTRVTNGINVLRTYIYYEKGYAGEAKALARQMPVAAKLKEVQSLDAPDIKVKILLGKDMIRYMKNPVKNSSPLNSWIGA